MTLNDDNSINTNRSIYEDDELHYGLVFERGIDFRNRIITVSTELEELFDVIDAGLTEMESRSSDPVTIRIKSGGGCVYDAQAVLGRMKASSCKIITEGYGMVWSAATVLLAGGDIRRASKYVSFMWHHGSVSFVDQDSAKILDEAKVIEKMNRVWSDMMAKFSKSRKANADYWYEIGKKDTYFDADELKKMGVIDEII